MQSLWMIAGGFFFGLYAVFIKLASFGGIDAFQLLFYRSAFGVLLISSLMAVHHVTPWTKHPWDHAARSIIGGIACVAGIFSISHLNIGLAMTLNYTSPLFLGAFTIAAALQHRMPVPWRLISMVALGFFGVVILLSPTISENEYAPAAVGLLAGFCTSVAVSFVKRLGSLHEPELRMVFYFVFVGMLMGLVPSLINGFTPLTWSAAGYLLAVALCANLAQMCITHAFSHGNLVLCGALQYTTILFSAIFGIVIFAEPLSLSSAAGMVIISVAGILATILVRKTPRPKKKAPKA